MVQQWKDHAGRRFGRLTAVRRLKGWPSRWRCRCMCGAQTIVSATTLVEGKTRSCGCLRAELSSKRRRTHGESNRTPEYIAWLAMVSRCTNKNRSAYKNYGGRGIKVCARWRKSFTSFLRDMGRRPSRLHSLDRFPDQNGNYCASNCRWATRRQQMQNKRDNHLLLFRGERLCLAVWGRRIGIGGQGIAYRLAHGWTLKRALTQSSKRPKGVRKC